ncbi:zona pellucida sperm-binding protein 1 [Melospiza georgiana]|uniref:zona pellucida sperm-binding protein 1 n=1 Tax=Melospiza georgiana TaxID=44398 RepID=UPI0025AC1F47|nr:zona pellucida sperm-binding protein 1 [Melospiza georgiana]
MGRSCSFLLLLFLLSPWPRATMALLQYRHDCGELGMQLLVFPSHGRTVRFKVLDEFGSRFDVANCSICLHWLSSREDGSVIFSSGYNGCHVLFKENRYVLRVQLEELLSGGIPVTSYEVNMTCPKPGGSEALPDGTQGTSRDSPTLFSHTGLHQVSGSSLTLTGSHFSAQDLVEQVHAPGIRPGSVSQNQPGMMHAGGQNQPGIRPGSVSPNQPGIRPGSASHNQPGIRPGPVSQNQPGMMHSVGQTQPGIRPGFAPGLYSKIILGVKTNQGFAPGLYSKIILGVKTNQGFAQGFISPGPQAEPQPGLGLPGLRPQPGLLHPGIHTQPSLLQPTALFYPSPGAVCFPPGMQLTREQCQVPVGRMPCVAPQGRDACLQAGCCYDDMDRTTPCYYGNTATVQCLLEGHFVLVVPRGMVALPYNLDTVRVAGGQAGCEPRHVSEAFVMFRFPVTHCGTTVQVIGDTLVYENQLISTIDVQGSPRGSVTRDSVYILRARCIYNSSDLLPLGVEVAVPPTSAPLAMLGPLALQLRIATDESYSSYHAVGDFPLVRVLRDPIYVEVRLLQKTDPNLVLVLHHCWASPGSHAASQPQWPILVEGCPFQGDNYRTRLIPMGPASPELPFPSHYQRFVISTFAFVEPPKMAVLEGEVYISCSASVCHLAQPEPCRPSCQLGVPSRARRSPGDRRTGDSMGTVTSQGCIVFPEAPKRGGTQQRG